MSPEELHTFMRQKLEVQERGREREGKGRAKAGVREIKMAGTAGINGLTGLSPPYLLQ